MVETTRFELVTPCMSSKYSNQLSYASKTFVLYHMRIEITIPFSKKNQFFKYFYENTALSTDTSMLRYAWILFAQQNYKTKQ